MAVARWTASLASAAVATLAAVIAALLALEVVFRAVLVAPVIPQSSEDLQSRVGAAWPHPVAVEPSPDTFRIVAIGDSFGVSGGYDNFNYMVERRLRRRNPRIEIVNLSLPALELHDQLQVWRRHGSRYRPDLVLHGVFVGNDLLMPEGELVDYRGIVMRRTSGLRSWHPRQWLLKRWWDRRGIIRRDELARAAEGSAGLALDSGPFPVALATLSASQGEGTFSEQEFLRIERQRLEVSGATPEWRTRRAEALAVIDTMRAAVVESGATYAIVLHPDQFQVEPDLRRRIAAAYDIDVEADYDLELPQRQIMEHCAAAGIVCLDLLAAFRAAGADGELYLPRDTHYSFAGNRLAAQQILAFVHREGLLP